MIKHICKCGYIYNPEYGDIDGDIEKGVKFEALPESWVCPFCGRNKGLFEGKEKSSKLRFRTST